MLLTFVKCLASFQNQQSNIKCEDKAIIDELYKDSVKRESKLNACESIQSIKSSTEIPFKCVTPLAISNDDIYDNVIINKNTNQPNYFNYQKVYQDGTDKTGYYTNAFFINTIKGKHSCSNSSNNEVKTNETKYQQKQQQTDNMGSNVSRHTAKGLSVRRTQSSGSV